MARPDGQRVGRPEHPRSAALSCFWLGHPSRGGRFMFVGALDLVTADHARDAIGRAQHETSALICDLGDVWFVDLSGLRVLLEAADRGRRTGGRVTIAHCPPVVPRMLALLGLHDALDIGDGTAPAAPPARRTRPGRLSNRPAPRGID